MDPLPWYRWAAPVVGTAALAVVVSITGSFRLKAMLAGIVVAAAWGMVQDQGRSFSLTSCRTDCCAVTDRDVTAPA